MKSSKKTPHNLIEIIISHQNECNNENCKCKLLRNIPKSACSSNDEFSKWLIESIGFIFETNLSNLNLYSNYKYSMLLSDYYFHIKENILMAYFIIQSIIYNSKKLPFRKLLECYGLKNFYYVISRNKFKSSKKAAKFNKMFEIITENFEVNKNIIKYCDIYDFLIDSKINFEGGLKYNFDKDTGELDSISSLWLNKINVNKALEKLYMLESLSKKIKSTIISKINQRSIEFYYTIFLFYSIFKGKIPKKVVELFSSIDLGNSFTNLSIPEIGKKLSSNLDIFFSSDFTSNRVIIKISQGLKIKYISPNLCNILGYVQSTILGEDFGKLFPKVMRDSFVKDILHYFLFKKNYFCKIPTYIFTQKGNIVPCLINGATLPHLGKSLLIISQIKIKRDKKILLLDSNFYGVSISKKVEEEFLINLKLLKKCDTEVSEIFDFHQKVIDNHFIDSFNLISKIQNELKLNVTDYFIKTLQSFEEQQQNEKRIPIEKDSLLINYSDKEFTEISLLRDKAKQQKFFFIKTREEIIQNIIKAFNKITDNTTKEENFKKLSHISTNVRNTQIMADSLKLNTVRRKTTNRKKTIQSNGFSEIDLNELTKTSNIEKFQFKVTIFLAYNIPFYVVKIREFLEEHQRILKKKLTNHFSTLSRKESKKIKETKKNRIQDFVHLTRNQILKISRQKTASNIKIEKVLIYLFSVLLFGLAALIIYNGLYRISKSQTVIGYYFRILFHRDKITALESFVISISFQFSGLAKMNFTNEEIMDRLKYQSVVQENSIIELYRYMNQYSKACKKNPISLLQNLTFYKVIKTWEVITFQSDYISEINYAIYLINLSYLENDIENMSKDIDMLFKSETIMTTSDTVLYINSNYGMVLFFLLRNLSGATTLIVKLYNEVIESLLSFTNKEQLLLLVFQSFWLILSLLFGVILLNLISKFNKRIYLTIIQMFLDKENKAYERKKNAQENSYMKQKVKLFINFIRNFNEENRNALEKFKIESLNEDLTLVGLTPNKNEEVTDSQSNTIGNSISFTNPQTNSTNHILTTNNSLIRVKHSLRVLPLGKQEKTGKKDILRKGISSPTLVKFLLKQPRGQILKWGIFIIIFYMLVCCALYTFMIINTVSFKKFLVRSQDVFYSFSTFFFFQDYLFNHIRIFIMRHSEIPNTIFGLISEMNSIENQLTGNATQPYIKDYPELKEIWTYFNMKYDSSDAKFSKLICNNKESCIRVYSKENSYCSKGILLGFKVILQKLSEISIDYNNFLVSNPDYSKEELEEFLDDKDFSNLQDNIEFLIIEIQTSIYTMFISDFDNVQKKLKKECYILYFVGFAAELVIVLIILLGLLRYLSKVLFLSLYGSTLFNFSFYKNIYEQKRSN